MKHISQMSKIGGNVHEHR